MTKPYIFLLIFTAFAFFYLYIQEGKSKGRRGLRNIFAIHDHKDFILSIGVACLVFAIDLYYSGQTNGGFTFANILIPIPQIEKTKLQFLFESTLSIICSYLLVISWQTYKYNKPRKENSHWKEYREKVLETESNSIKILNTSYVHNFFTPEGFRYLMEQFFIANDKQRDITFKRLLVVFDDKNDIYDNPTINNLTSHSEWTAFENNLTNLKFFLSVCPKTKLYVVTTKEINHLLKLKNQRKILFWQKYDVFRVDGQTYQPKKKKNRIKLNEKNKAKFNKKLDLIFEEFINEERLLENVINKLQKDVTPPHYAANNS